MIIFFALICLPAMSITGQNRRSLATRTPVVFWVDWDCLNNNYPKARLNRAIRKVMEQNGGPGHWGDRAMAYDLNGDRVAEYFVPLVCGAVGNCSWGIFSSKPLKVLGVVNAEDIYVHKRLGKWATLTTYIHDNASEGYLTNYSFRGGHYRRRGGNRNVSAYATQPGFDARGLYAYPAFMKTITSPCSPGKVR